MDVELNNVGGIIRLTQHQNKELDSYVSNDITDIT